MAMADATSKCFDVFMYYCEEDQENALKLMEFINKNPNISCSGPDRSPGKDRVQCIEKAIDAADYFILFLSHKSLVPRHEAWIRAIVHKVKQETNNKLTIVLYLMSKHEFNNNVEKKFDLTIKKENVIYDPRLNWDRVAMQIFKNLKLKSTELEKKSGKKAPTIKIGIIHDDDVHQEDNSSRANIIAETICSLFPDDQVIWSDKLNPPCGTKVKDINIEFLKSCQRVFVILTAKWETSNWYRHFPAIISEAGLQSQEKYKITFILLDQIQIPTRGRYEHYNRIKIDDVSNITHTIIQNFITSIDAARPKNND